MHTSEAVNTWWTVRQLFENYVLHVTIARVIQGHINTNIVGRHHHYSSEVSQFISTARLAGGVQSAGEKWKVLQGHSKRIWYKAFWQYRTLYKKIHARYVSGRFFFSPAVSQTTSNMFPTFINFTEEWNHAWDQFAPFDFLRPRTKQKHLELKTAVPTVSTWGWLQKPMNPHYSPY